MFVRTCLLAGLLMVTHLPAITFTGNAELDFAGSNYGEQLDFLNDVGLPTDAPQGCVSGWDIDRVLFAHDESQDALLVGIKFYGHAGDADGDGGEGTTSAWLAGHGGVDLPMLDMTESICVAFDFSLDWSYELIAGVSSMSDQPMIADWSSSDLGQSYSFGQARSVELDWTHHGDVEFRIDGISDLNQIDPYTICFNFRVFAGSFQDSGVGEDILECTLCLTDDCCGEVEAIAPEGLTLLAGYPNPFNHSVTLQLELAQTAEATLGLYNLQGRLLHTLHDGMIESGLHKFRFDASNLPSGIYLARLESTAGSQVLRLLHLK